jgi:hypothetical protein
MLSRETIITCDGGTTLWPCRNLTTFKSFAGERVFSESEVRNLLRQSGWVFQEGKDLCFEHKGEYRGW